MWTSTDPKEQLWGPYGYSSNPINTVDPNGEWIGALIALGEWYVGNSISQGSFNPGKWNWNDPNLWMSTIMTAFSVGMDLGNDISNLAASKPQTTDANEFGHAGSADNANVKPLDRYPDPDDPTAQQLNTRSGEYQAKKLPKSPYECSRYTGYEIEGKVLTPEQLTAKATDPMTLTITDPGKLDPTKVYSVTWQQADPQKVAQLQAAGRSIQHSGAYYNGYVWHTVKGYYLTSEYGYLQGLMSNAGYTIGPTFRLW